MKRSKQPTGAILISAQVCSEWDSCNSCLVEFSQVDIDRWKRYDEIATKLKNDGTTFFSHISIWEGSDFLDIDENRVPKEWCYITFKPDEFDKKKPDQEVDAQQLKFYGDGAVCFIGYGKHTSEEFWSETININELKA